MSIELRDDNARDSAPPDEDRDALERRRDRVIGRLARVMRALDRRRLAVQGAVSSLVPAREGTTVGISKGKLLAAVAIAGGLFVLGMVTQRRMRARRMPLARFGRALGAALRPKPAPLAGLGVFLGKAVGTLAARVASNAVRLIVARAVQGAPPEEIPVDPDQPSPTEPDGPPPPPVETASRYNDRVLPLAPVVPTMPPMQPLGTMIR